RGNSHVSNPIQGCPTRSGRPRSDRSEPRRRRAGHVRGRSNYRRERCADPADPVRHAACFNVVRRSLTGPDGTGYGKRVRAMFPPLRLREALTLGGLSPRECALRTWAKVNENEIMTRAAAVSFYAMLALIPFLALVLTLSVQLLPDLTGLTGKTSGI